MASASEPENFFGSTPDSAPLLSLPPKIAIPTPSYSLCKVHKIR